jgi:hypothetical protein
MLTIIHGDDIVSSRKYFLDLKQQHADALSFDGEKLNLTDLTQIFEGGGLFTETKTIFIEQFLSKKARGKKSVELESVIAYLEKNGSEHTITLWESKDLERGAQTTFKTATIKAFKLPQTLFVFLDNIKPGNGKMLLSLFHQTTQHTEVEMVFFMLVRQVRLLLALHKKSDEEIDELKRMAPWQKGKLEKQSALFETTALKHLYNGLFTIEVGQKTGGLSAPLQTTIDFLLLEI